MPSARENILERIKTVLEGLNSPSYSVVRRVNDIQDKKEDPNTFPLIVILDDDSRNLEMMNKEERNIIDVRIIGKFETMTPTETNEFIDRIKLAILNDTGAGSIAALTDFVRFIRDVKRRVVEHRYVSIELQSNITYSEKVFTS